MPTSSRVTSQYLTAGTNGSGMIHRGANPYEDSIVYEGAFQCSINNLGYTTPTFTRSTVRNANTTPNTLRESPINEARFEDGRMLMEQPTTNYCLSNENLADLSTNSPAGPWVLSNVDTPTQDGTAGPEAGSLAWKVSATANGNAYIAQALGALDMESWGFWAKAGTTSTISILTQDLVSSPINQSVSSGNLTLTNEWKWYALTTTASTNVLAIFTHSGNGGGSSTAGDSFYIYQPCMFDQSETSRSVPTTTTAVTHTADDMTIPIGNMPQPGANYALAFTLELVADTGAAQSIIKFQGETNGRRLIINTSKQLRYGYGSTVDNGTTPLTIGQEYRVMITGSNASPTAMKAYLNGVQEISTNATGYGGTSTTLEPNYNADGFFKIKDIVCYNRYFSTAAEANQEAESYGF